MELKRYIQIDYDENEKRKRQLSEALQLLHEIRDDTERALNGNFNAADEEAKEAAPDPQRRILELEGELGHYRSAEKRHDLLIRYLMSAAAGMGLVSWIYPEMMLAGLFMGPLAYFLYRHFKKENSNGTKRKD